MSEEIKDRLRKMRLRLEIEGRHSLLNLLEGIEDAITSLTAELTAARAEVERLRKLLGRVLSFTAQRCPCRDETPDPCTLCGARADALGDDGVCKAQTFAWPPGLLLDMEIAARAALTPAEEVEG